MKRSVLIALALTLCASMAFAQQSIMAFSDPGGASCEWNDVGPGLQSVYVFHTNTTGATAGEWTLGSPPATWSYLGESSPFTLVIGNSLEGVSISYQACLQNTFLLMTVNFFGSGLEQPCTYFGIINAQVIDCAQGRDFPPGGQGIVNPVDPDCLCNVPVAETTWGGIKALYK